MDPLSNLYDRLRHRSTFATGSAAAAGYKWLNEPPQLQDWLRFWNNDDAGLGNLRNFEHWISRARPRRRSQGRQRLRGI